MLNIFFLKIESLPEVKKYDKNNVEPFRDRSKK